MTDTLRTLLRQSLDYAGLFPPASLPMAQAAAIFRREGEGPASFLLARLVCPASRLNELAGAPPLSIAPVRIAAILRGGKTAGECLANLEADLASLAAFPGRLSSGLCAETLELKLPPDALAGGALRKLLAAIITLLGRQPGQARQLFLEIAPSAALGEQLPQLAESAASLRETTGIGLGYKLRTGGSDAAAIPSIPLVASVLTAAHTHRLPMKCTGGLHHPLRGRRAGVDHALHGFINLLTAAALAHNRQVPSEVLEAVLAEEQPHAFVFGPEKLDWRDFSLTDSEIAAARAQLLVSFGSCYADIPQTELRRLGWWE